MKTFNSSNEELLQLPAFRTFFQRDGGLPLRFVGLDKQIDKTFRVKASTDPGHDFVENLDL